MFFKSTAILLALAVLPILGQYVHDGQCRTDVEVVQNFDVDKVSHVKEFFKMVKFY